MTASGDRPVATEGRLPVSVLLLLRDEVRDVEELLPSLGFAAESPARIMRLRG